MNASLYVRIWEHDVEQGEPKDGQEHHTNHVDAAGMGVFDRAVTPEARPKKQLIAAMMGNALESYGLVVYPFLGSIVGRKSFAFRPFSRRWIRKFSSDQWLAGLSFDKTPEPGERLTG